MISEFFINLAMGFVTWLTSLAATDWVVPPEIASFDDTVSGFISSFVGLSVWAPWALMIGCVTVAVTTWLVCLLIKALRAVAAHVPLVGGAG